MLLLCLHVPILNFAKTFNEEKPYEGSNSNKWQHTPNKALNVRWVLEWLLRLRPDRESEHQHNSNRDQSMFEVHVVVGYLCRTLSVPKTQLPRTKQDFT